MMSLQDSKVIPDVIDGVKKDDAVDMTVKFKTSDLIDGTTLSKDETEDEPEVRIIGAQGLCTLIMVDPDAPDPADPKWREFLHWLVTNISQGNVTSGDVKMPYLGTAPPKGKHRYVLTLWQQSPSDEPDRFADQHPIQASAPEDRKNFSTKEFAKKHDLTGPLHCDYFYCEAE